METSMLENEEVLHESEKLLKATTLLIGESLVRYRLVNVAAQYLLRVDGGVERCVLDVGDTLSTAAYVQEMFVRGRVTPDTAQEIWEELYEQGFFEEKTVLCPKIP